MAADGPGAVGRRRGAAPAPGSDRERRQLLVRNESLRVVRVSSHIRSSGSTHGWRSIGRQQPGSASICRPASPSAGRRARSGSWIWCASPARAPTNGGRTNRDALPLARASASPATARSVGDRVRLGGHGAVGARRRGPPGARRRADLGLREDPPAADDAGGSSVAVRARRRRRGRARHRSDDRRGQGRHRDQGRPDRGRRAGPATRRSATGSSWRSARTRRRSWPTD